MIICGRNLFCPKFANSTCAQKTFTVTVIEGLFVNVTLFINSTWDLLIAPTPLDCSAKTIHASWNRPRSFFIFCPRSKKCKTNGRVCLCHVKYDSMSFTWGLVLFASYTKRSDCSLNMAGGRPMEQIFTWGQLCKCLIEALPDLSEPVNSMINMIRWEMG